MKLTINESAGTITLTAVNDEDRVFIEAVAARTALLNVLKYDGRDSRINALFFKIDENRLTLRTETDADRQVMGVVRDAIFYGHTGGLIYLGLNVEDPDSIIVTCGRCKGCGKNLIHRHETASEICDDCATRCHHHYVQGHILSHKGLAEGLYCKYCMRAKPDQQLAFQKGMQVL